MKVKTLKVSCAAALMLAVTAAACQKSSPVTPSDVSAASPAASMTDAKTGVTIIAARPTSPANGGGVAYASQPAVLTVANGVTTGSTALTYTFEVASDSGFSSKVFTKDGVAGGASGTTSQTVDARLPGGNTGITYFWRVRANSGSTQGPNSAVFSFKIGPEIVLGIPTLSSPGPNGVATGSQATLVVSNVSKSGPFGQIRYRFDVSTSSSFSSTLFTTTVNEGSSGSTSATVNAALAGNTNYFWRVQALDATNNVTGTYSPVGMFQFQQFDMCHAIMEDNPPDVGCWDVTATITRVEFTGDAFLVDFDRRDGPNAWPDLNTNIGPIQYTLGLCGKMGDGLWHCSAAVDFWAGRELEASTPPSYVARNWYYDARWGGLLGWQPADGEQVGVFAATGNLRGNRDPVCPQVCERTNVQFVSWQNDAQVLYTFAATHSVPFFRFK